MLPLGAAFTSGRNRHEVSPSAPGWVKAREAGAVRGVWEKRDETRGNAAGLAKIGQGGTAAQSSGILIQPWRMAYTTAWVRSLTDSFRRIELMWFFTVCSLIDSA